MGISDKEPNELQPGKSALSIIWAHPNQATGPSAHPGSLEVGGGETMKLPVTLRALLAVSGKTLWRTLSVFQRNLAEFPDSDSMGLCAWEQGRGNLSFLGRPCDWRKVHSLPLQTRGKMGSPIVPEAVIIVRSLLSGNFCTKSPWRAP